jgi:small subunit ribosomal protein S11
MSKNSAKQKVKRNIKVNSGIVYITASFNNVIITITDSFGNALTASSSGQKGFKGAKKSTPFAAQMVAEDATTKAKELYGLKTVAVIINGPGAGRETAIKTLVNNGLIVTSIKDVTCLPHNGCRQPKKRRI